MVTLDGYGCERSDAKVEKTMCHTSVYENTAEMLSIDRSLHL